MKKLLLVIILLIIVLLLTNPTQADYNSWVNEKLAQQLEYNSKGAIGKVISPLTNMLVNSVTERHNYYIFSIYETEIANNEINRTIGFFKMFVSLK